MKAVVVRSDERAFLDDSVSERVGSSESTTHIAEPLTRAPSNGNSFSKPASPIIHVRGGNGRVAPCTAAKDDNKQTIDNRISTEADFSDHVSSSELDATLINAASNGHVNISDLLAKQGAHNMAKDASG